MNFILMQAGYPPVIIPVEQRSRYYTTLKEANEGDLRPFIRFVAEHADKALQVFFVSKLKISFKFRNLVLPECNFSVQYQRLSE
jgi:hypothetical protein